MQFGAPGGSFGSTPAIQVAHVPAVCAFQEQSPGAVEWGSDRSITQEGGRAAPGPDLGSIYFGDRRRGSARKGRDAERGEQVRGESGGHGTWSADRR